MSTGLFRTALAILTLGGYALRSYGLHHQSFWLDEVDAIAFAAEPVSAQVRKFSSVGENGPLYFLLFKGWLALSGTSEFGARYLSAAASTMAIPLLGVVAHRLCRQGAIALCAAGLAAASPYYVWYAQDAKMYALYAVLALGAQYCLLRGWMSSKKQEPSGEQRSHHASLRRSLLPWWAGYVVCASFALYVHLFAALQIAANTVASLWLWRSRPLGRRGFIGATLLLVAPYLPLAAWQDDVLLAGANVGYQPASLKTIVVALLEQLVWHVNPPPDGRWLALLSVILLSALWRSRGGQSPSASASSVRPARRYDHAAALLAIWLIVPVALTLLLQNTVPVFRDRYLIPLLAPLLILIARAMAPAPGVAGLDMSGAPGVNGATGLIASAFVAVSFGYGLLHRPPNPDFRAAAELVRQAAAPDEPVGFLAEYAERPFNFYFRKTSSGNNEKLPLPYTNYPDLSERDGLIAVARSVRAGRRLWIVRFEEWLWDGRDLVGRYLTSRGATMVLRREFNGVSVTQYELPG